MGFEFSDRFERMDTGLGSTVTQTPFQRDMILLASNLVASRIRDIFG